MLKHIQVSSKKNPKQIYHRNVITNLILISIILINIFVSNVSSSLLTITGPF